MIKRVLTPSTNNILLSIPESYIGKEIEALIYATDEIEEVGEEKEEVQKTNNAACFKGLLTKEDTEKYRQYLKQARSEWDRGT